MTVPHHKNVNFPRTAARKNVISEYKKGKRILSTRILLFAEHQRKLVFISASNVEPKATKKTQHVNHSVSSFAKCSVKLTFLIP